MSSLHEWRPDLAIAPSRTISGALATWHLLALGLLPFSHVGWGWGMFIGAVFVAQWYMLECRYGRLASKHAVRRVLWMDDGWMLETADGMQGPYRLSPASRVTRNLMLLHFCRNGLLAWIGFGAVLVPIVRDNVGQERFHLMQIFMRWQRLSVLNPQSLSSGKER